MARLTETQWRVIGILGHQARTLPDLAYVMERKDSSCRPMVQRLRDHGLVASLGRSHVLALTAAGRALLSERARGDGE